MIDPKNVFCLIPARAGSKRLPNKNFRTMIDRPLFMWTVDAAIGADLKPVISSDYSMKDTVQAAGGTYLFRPDKLCGDNVSTEDILNYYLETEMVCKKRSWLMVLQPTSPTRTAFQINQFLSQCDPAQIAFYANIDQAEPNGSIYLVRRDFFSKHKTFTANFNYRIIITTPPIIDINTQADWDAAEAELKLRDRHG